MASRTALRALSSTVAPAPRLYAARRFASSSSTPSPNTEKGKGKATSSTSSATPSASSPAAAGKPAGDYQVLEPPKDENGAYIVPPLSRPPGVPIPPSTDARTWAKRREQLLDKERRKTERKLLIKEATQGYFHDYNLARKANGGKLWVGPPVLIREDVSGRELAVGARWEGWTGMLSDTYEKGRSRADSRPHSTSRTSAERPSREIRCTRPTCSRARSAWSRSSTRVSLR